MSWKSAVNKKLPKPVAKIGSGGGGGDNKHDGTDQKPSEHGGHVAHKRESAAG